MTTTTRRNGKGIYAKPLGWQQNTDEELLASQAGIAYAHEYAEQFDCPKPTVQPVDPEHTFGGSYEEQCTYYVYPDGSLWFLSSGDDEVWNDYRDYVDEKMPDDLTNAFQMERDIKGLRLRDSRK